MPDADTVWLTPLDELAATLERAGLVVTWQEDHSRAHRATAQALADAFAADAAAIAAQIGRRALDELLAAHRLWIEWLDEGRVRKLALVAERPKAGSFSWQTDPRQHAPQRAPSCCAGLNVKDQQRDIVLHIRKFLGGESLQEIVHLGCPPFLGLEEQPPSDAVRREGKHRSRRQLDRPGAGVDVSRPCLDRRGVGRELVRRGEWEALQVVRCRDDGDAVAHGQHTAARLLSVLCDHRQDKGCRASPFKPQVLEQEVVVLALSVETRIEHSPTDAVVEPPSSRSSCAASRRAPCARSG